MKRVASPEDGREREQFQDQVQRRRRLWDSSTLGGACIRGYPVAIEGAARGMQDRQLLDLGLSYACHRT